MPGVAQLKFIARGGCAEVWEGYEERNARFVAVKVFALPVTDVVARELFEKECQNVGLLDRIDNAIRIHHTDVLSNLRPYLIMELCETSLAALVGDRGRLQPARVTQIGLDVISALIGYHPHGVHGDVKPANILIRNTHRAALSDFGLSLRHDDTGGVIVGGTPEFASPEQLLGRKATTQDDLYGLGASLYFALTGHSPHPPRNGLPVEDYARAIRAFRREPLSGVPKNLNEIIDDLLETDPQRRPASAADVAIRLAAVDTRQAPPATPKTEFRVTDPDDPQPLPPKPKPGRRHGRVAIIGAAVVVVAVAAFLASRGLSRVDPPTTGAHSSAAAGPRASLPPVVLAEPVDRGTEVELSWTGPQGMDYAVAIAAEGEQARSQLLGKVTTYKAAVDPGKKYCFQILATDGRVPLHSEPKGIRGVARCDFG